MKFSDIELQHLFRAWIAISLAFGILLSGGNLLSNNFLINVLIAGFTVGVGFLFHELGHKFIAQRYNCFAEFRAYNSMLLLAIAMSFFGFIFAAPGAVMIRGYVDVKKNGKISLAGPIMNIILALIFLGAILIGFSNKFTNIGFFINGFLAAFNLIPVWNFDGSKVLRWNKAVYFIALAISIILLVLGYGYI